MRRSALIALSASKHSRIALSVSNYQGVTAQSIHQLTEQGEPHLKEIHGRKFRFLVFDIVVIQTLYGETPGRILV